MLELTPLEFQAWCGDLSARLQRNVTTATEENLTDLRDTARVNSLGPLSTRVLRALGNPFARRHGKPLLDPGIVHQQSGLFGASWVMGGVEQRGGDLFAMIWNSDPKAPLLKEGTEMMFARPVDVKTLAECEPRMQGRYDDAFRDVFG
jgi:hypothetical protein